MPDPDYTITVADAADAREIYDLQLAAYATEALLYDEPIPPVVQTWEDAAADFPQWLVLKLTADGHIVGSVRVRIEDGACQIGRLMVLPAYRGRGYGSALLEAAERAYPAVPYELFTGDRSLANIAMYLRHGYSIICTDNARGLVFFRKTDKRRTDRFVMLYVRPDRRGNKTVMDYLAIIQDSIDQIEDQVRGDIRVDRLAARAGFSTYHYYRIFEAYVGIPVMEYARRRRLAHAAYAMNHTPRLIDVALEYGFETHAGFSKTFRRHMGVSPEQYRIHMVANPPQRIVLSDIIRYIPNGGIVMEPRIYTKPAAKIAGLSIRTSSVDGRNNREIPAFWMSSMQDGSLDKLHAAPGVVSHNELGLCVQVNMETGEFDYVIGLEVADLAAVPDALYKMDLPECTYAVFTTPPSEPAEFSKTIQGTWKFIYSEWFPSSGYEFAAGHPDFELYRTEPGKNNPTCDIYIPIAKKA